MLALIGIYVCYGFIMGIGLGTGYLSPVKTLMLWFEDRKGLATGLAVAGFGAAKAIASPIMQALLKSLGKNGIWQMFLILAAVYFVMMFVGHLLLAKPAGWHEPAKQEKGQKAIDVIKTKPVVFVGICFWRSRQAGMSRRRKKKDRVSWLPSKPVLSATMWASG